MQIAPTVGTPFQASLVLQRLNILHKEDINFDPVMILEDPYRLEERALDLVEQASVKELYRILYILSRHRHRNMSLIRAVSYHLNKSDLSDLSAVQLSNLLYACAVLKVFDTPLLEKTSLALQTKQRELTPKLAQSVLTSMSLLRWGHSQTVQYMVDQLNCRNWSSALFHSDDECVSKTKDIPLSLSLGRADRVAIVMSLANLNKNNPMCCELVHKVIATPDVSELQKSSPFLWLDVVWSLAVLKLLNANLAASVLTEDFWGSLPVSDSFQSIVNFTKINNINIAAKYEIQGYTGPYLPDTFCPSDAKLLLRSERKAAEKVISALLHMAPRDSYAILDATVEGGYVIDAEFFVDDSGEPQPLTKVGKSSSLLHRVALKVLDFPDLTLPDLEMTGLHAMEARHLSYQGFTVVHV
ncbi:hypothetical protein C0Q70_04321 [Pomacea canaliculata]|uniref:Uncharacterized protein n=1 Tax=Pomacea canaliculata TaxID=400727 RepID=A0A2T7PV74_POMCA|nr:hypothetical protein C0Q70_04321 [Pomacea canaliculata]